MVALFLTQPFEGKKRSPLDTKCDVLLCFQLNQWPRSVSAMFRYAVYPITFSVGNADEWKKLFKPCAAQRLFLPVRLQLLSPLISSVATHNVINQCSEKKKEKTSLIHSVAAQTAFSPYPLFYPSVWL